MARKPLAAGARRSVPVSFRISTAQRAVIENDARAAGVAMPDYVRAVLTGGRRPVPDRTRRSRDARPTSWREDSRIAIRMTRAEADYLRSRAERAGITVGRYARAVLAGRRPRARQVRPLPIRALIYELQSLAANFRQLHTATANRAYEEWRRHVGVSLPLELTGPHVDAEEISRHVRPINRAGQKLNHLAWKANSGQFFSEVDEERVLDAVADAVEALEADLGVRLRESER